MAEQVPLRLKHDKETDRPLSSYEITLQIQKEPTERAEIVTTENEDGKDIPANLETGDTNQAETETKETAVSVETNANDKTDSPKDDVADAATHNGAEKDKSAVSVFAEQQAADIIASSTVEQHDLTPALESDTQDAKDIEQAGDSITDEAIKGALQDLSDSIIQTPSPPVTPPPEQDSFAEGQELPTPGNQNEEATPKSPISDYPPPSENTDATDQTTQSQDLPPETSPIDDLPTPISPDAEVPEGQELPTLDNQNEETAPKSPVLDYPPPPPENTDATDQTTQSQDLPPETSPADDLPTPISQDAELPEISQVPQIPDVTDSLDNSPETSPIDDIPTPISQDTEPSASSLNSQNQDASQTSQNERNPEFVDQDLLPPVSNDQELASETSHPDTLEPVSKTTPPEISQVVSQSPDQVLASLVSQNEQPASPEVEISTDNVEATESPASPATNEQTSLEITQVQDTSVTKDDDLTSADANTNDDEEKRTTDAVQQAAAADENDAGEDTSDDVKTQNEQKENESLQELTQSKEAKEETVQSQETGETTPDTTQETSKMTATSDTQAAAAQEQKADDDQDVQPEQKEDSDDKEHDLQRTGSAMTPDTELADVPLEETAKTDDVPPRGEPIETPGKEKKGCCVIL